MTLSILVVHPYVPPRNRDSGSLRLFRLIELMREQGHRVTLVARQAAGQEAAALELEGLGVEVHRGEPNDLEGLVRRVRPDVAWLSFFHLAEDVLPVVRRASPGTRVAVDTVDVHFLREQRAAELSGRAEDRARAASTRRREEAVYAAADVLVAVSADDAAALEQLAPGVPVAVVSNVHAPEPAGPGHADRDGVVFVGNYHHAPNVDAVVHFCAAIWPRVTRALPGARLTLVGTAPPPEVLALAGAGVDVAGWVPETAPYLDAARVSIAPLRYGAGVKGKVGEAMARGLPVVTTSIGSEGMGLVDGEHLLVADGDDAFADAVVRLHEDAELWQRLARDGRGALDAKLGVEAARDALHGLLALLAPRTFVATGDDGSLDPVLAGYLGAFAAGDPVSLIVPLRDGADVDALYARLVEAIGRAGHDPERIPDVAVTAWPSGSPLPAGATAVDADTPAGVWHAVPARDEESPPRAALVVRLAADPADAGPQLDALAAAGVPGDVEVLVCAEPGLDVAPPFAHRLIDAPAVLGRRAVLQRALGATRAPIVIALEPHALPRPGFAEPLLRAVADGAVLAAPVVDGAHGFRVAADGALWPMAPGPAPDALAFDCLAGTRETLLELPFALPAREGLAEVQLAAWARERGRLVVAADAMVDRAPAPPASVLICTRNRADELEDCIELLVASGAVDVVIVDNASTDATAEVAAQLAARHPGVVRTVFEARAGLCHARNAGAAAARHDLLLYIDDDARPAPGWLPAVARELARPGVINVGGPIAGLWPEERRAGWPEAGLERLLSVLDLGDADCSLVPPKVVYGANWAVRRDALEAIGGFDPQFGPGPDARINGDEVSVAWRLHRAGLGETRYVAAAAVGHRIPPSRVDDTFLVHRALAAGIEGPRHATALDGLDPEWLLREANNAAATMLRVVQVPGDHRLEEVVDAIVSSGLPTSARVTAADALGKLTGALLLLEQTEVDIGSLRLRLDAMHLNGVLRPTVAA